MPSAECRVPSAFVQTANSTLARLKYHYYHQIPDNHILIFSYKFLVPSYCGKFHSVANIRTHFLDLQFGEFAATIKFPFIKSRNKENDLENCSKDYISVTSSGLVSIGVLLNGATLPVPKI